jgi:hypothetical protein
MSSANFYDESRQEVANVRKGIYDIISKSAKYNDARDMKIHGYIQGGAMPKSKVMRDIDKYVLDVTSGMMEGSGFSAGGYTAGGYTGGKKKVKKAETKKSNVPKQLNAWMSLVQKVRKERPELSYKEVLQVAKTMYKK